MRLTTLAIAATVLVAGFALADPTQGSAQGQHQSQIDRLTTELNLSADQKEKVQKVLDQQHAKMQSMRSQAQSSGQQRPSREEMHKQRAAMNQEMEDQLKPILSDEQMQKFKQLQQQHQSHMGQRQGQRPEGSQAPNMSDPG